MSDDKARCVEMHVGKTPQCLHCAIWRAIADHHGGPSISAHLLSGALIEVLADVVTSAPSARLIDACRDAFPADLAAAVAKRREERAARPEGFLQ